MMRIEMQGFTIPYSKRHQLVSDAAAAHCQPFDSSFWDDSIVTELNQSISLQYQKLKKGKNGEDDSVGPLPTNVSAKYVIIEEDEHDDGA
uniref:Uncharacterized protein n=1 Tax=Quercus lobata TaxID=97700 RepID=A0A7N2MBU6_QUELO